MPTRNMAAPHVAAGRRQEADAREAPRPAAAAWGERVREVPLWLAAGVVAVLAILLWFQPVLDAGWYYDDWALASAMQDAPSRWWPDLFEACRSFEPAGRPGGCVYHASVYTVLGDHIKGYHLLNIVLLAGSSVLLFMLLVACRLPRAAALAVVALYVVYPGSDATRIWPTAIGAQYILAAYLAGVLLAIAALRRTGWQAAALHAASFALFLLMVFTYEIVLPLIAIDGLYYLLAEGRRRAVVVRAAADLAFATAFAAYRAFFAEVQETSGFVVDRTIGQWLDRVEAVLGGGWDSWHLLFAPGPVAPVVYAVAAVVVVVAAVRSPAVRPALARWLGVAALATGVAMVAVIAYVTANDLYVPQTGGTFNRLNLAAAPAYCVAFVALAALVLTALRTWLSLVPATAIVVALALAVAIDQVGVQRDSQAAWHQSWQEQVYAVNAMKRTFGPVPENASVMTFGHPIWERGFVPVFSAGWDLRGAIDYSTAVDPPRAIPFLPGVACGADAVTFDRADYLPYDGDSPVWFANTASNAVLEVPDRATCERMVREWGPPRFWGTTVSAGT